MLEAPEWRDLAAVSTQLTETSAALSLPEEKEWLRFVLGEVAEQMLATIAWAEDLARRSEQESRTREESVYIMPADAARSDVVVASYCLDFMLSEGLIEKGAGSRLAQRLRELQKALEEMIGALRGSSFRFSLN